MDRNPVPFNDEGEVIKNTNTLTTLKIFIKPNGKTQFKLAQSVG